MPGLVYLRGCPDSDSDGIIDEDDLCPTILGLAKFGGCPDTDNDGIPDPNDKCPNEAGPIPNGGCPNVDSDGDGVLDNVDECKNSPGLPNSTDAQILMEMEFQIMKMDALGKKDLLIWVDVQIQIEMALLIEMIVVQMKQDQNQIEVVPRW